MPTENDLRTALLDYACETEIDERAMRDRIEHTLAAPVRPMRSRFSTLAAVAACIAAAVGIAIAVNAVQDRHTTQPGTPTPTPSPTPTIYGAPQFPGTITLAEYSGKGSKTIDVSGHPKPADLGYGFVYTCQGNGSFDVSGEMFTPACGGHTGGASLPGKTLTTLRITTPANVSWQLTLVAEPPIRTNATVVNAPPSGGGGYGERTGRGDGRVTLGKAASAGSYRIWLSCHGSGATISSVSKLVTNDYTHTCFAGYWYAWDVAKGTAPTTLNVAASNDTTWSIVVTPN